MASTRIPAVITYHKPGTQPPLFVAGTFSHPPWQPYEMEHSTREDGEFDFKKEVYGEPGSRIEYKFRIGDGDWWVLKDDGPVVTDSSGITNHVLEFKPQQEQVQSTEQLAQRCNEMLISSCARLSGEQSESPHDSQSRQNADDGKPLSYAQAAANRLQSSTDAADPDRSGTGTPIFARTAAEVADSAELLHEEVPERGPPERGEANGDSLRDVVKNTDETFKLRQVRSSYLQPLGAYHGELIKSEHDFHPGASPGRWPPLSDATSRRGVSPAGSRRIHCG